MKIKTRIEGNVAFDIVKEWTNSGKARVTNKIVTNDGKDDNGKTKWMYIPVVAYEKRAEFMANFYKKGSAIGCWATLREYQNTNGEWKHVFMIDEFDFPPKDFKPAESENTQPQQIAQPQPKPQPQAMPMGDTYEYADDLPF